MKFRLRSIRVVSWPEVSNLTVCFAVKKKQVDEENLKQFSRLHDIAVRKNDLIQTKNTYLRRPTSKSRNAEMVKAATEISTEKSVEQSLKSQSKT